MRSAFLLLLIVVGGLRIFEVPINEAPAGPPLEIRLDGSLEPDREKRIREICAEFPLLERHRTSHFEILSDLDDETIAEHGQLLERTVHAVEDFSRFLGYDIESFPNRQRRHLVLAFSDRNDFIKFAGNHDKINAAWLGGYFAPLSGHLAYHTAANHPDLMRIANRIERAEEGGDDERHQDIRRRMSRFVIQADASVVVHEATHMLLHHFGVAPATSRQPMWLLEGLAGSFEPAEASRRFGPMRPENGRTRDFRKLLREDRVPQLSTLVREREFPKGHQNTQANYATSAALCSWLARHRPRELRRFLDNINNAPDEETRAMDMAGIDDAMEAPVRAGVDWLADFETVFGDIEEIEKTWLRSERAAASLPIANGEFIESWD